ncbi:MAG: hypothetical protein ACE5IH_05630 [Thermodesulfobacteriota bacterium]
MKTLKRWLIVILIIVMPLFLFACDGDTENSSNNGGNNGGNKGTVNIGGGTT